MKHWKNTAPLLLIAVAIGVSFFYNLGSAPLFDRDEGAFSEATREMFERRDFISTYLNGQPRFDKPILVYWFQALGMLVFGVTEVAFRLPSALAGALWVVAVYGFAVRYLDKTTGWVAAIMTATSLWVSLIGRAATADALLNVFLVLCLFDIYRYAEHAQAKHRNLAFLWAGLGVLTKGPIGLAIPGLVSLIFFGWQKRWKEWVNAAFHPISLAIFLTVTLPWYLAQYLKQGQAFIAGFFLKHNVERFLSPMEGHSGGVYYYVLMLLLLVFPYTTLCIHIFGRLREARDSSLDLFLWIWFFCVLIFFTISRTKLPHYVLPGCTPLFVLMAKYRNDLRSRILALLPALLFLLLVLFVPEIVEQIRLRTPETSTRHLLAEADSILGVPYRVWACLALAGLGGLLWIKKFSAWQSLLMAAFIVIFIVAHLVLPAGLNLMQLPVKEAALLAKQEGYPVVMWKIRMPSFSVYREQVTPRRAPNPGEVVVTRVKHLELLPGYDLLYTKGGIALALVRGQL